jgi:hypothetical protein
MVFADIVIESIGRPFSNAFAMLWCIRSAMLPAGEPSVDPENDEGKIKVMQEFEASSSRHL